MVLVYPSAHLNQTYLARVSAPMRLRKSESARALPGADRAPAFDANVAGDLRHFGQRVQFVERPRLLVVDKAGHFELVGFAVDLRRLVLVVIGVERERPGDRAFGKFRRELGAAEQRRLRAVIEARTSCAARLRRYRRR